MSLSIAIVGLPNVGKSTLFNALVENCKAQAENYPFCTIEPNVGIVEVPDERLKKLAKISKSQKIVPAAIEFVDIAGLVRGANKGEGLGNQFLAHIRECDAVAMVVRFFQDENVVHVEGKIDPTDDIQTIETEIALADLATIEKYLRNIEKDAKNNKEIQKTFEILQKIKSVLDEGKNAREINLSNDEQKLVKNYSLISMKPVLYVANCSETQLANFDEIAQEKNLEKYNFIPISAKIESELNELPKEEKKEFLETLNITDSGLNRLIKEAYKTLGLITFFTSGEPETRAWTTKRGATAPQAAGVIHTDFQRGFIAAEIIPWQTLVESGGWVNARAKGLVRTEGKEYIVKDGDVALFKFNV